MDEILWLNKDDDDDDENKTYTFQYMSSFCILHLLLINLSVCNKLLTIENFWKKHLSVWSHAAIKMNNFFSGNKILSRTLTWKFEDEGGFLVCHKRQTSSRTTCTSIQRKKTWNSSKLYRDSSWPFVLPMSHFNNMSGETNWCFTFWNCSEIIVDPSKSKGLRV